MKITVSSCIRDSLLVVLVQNSEEPAAALSSGEVTPKKTPQSEPTEYDDLLEEGNNLLKEGSVDDLFKESSGMIFSRIFRPMISPRNVQSMNCLKVA